MIMGDGKKKMAAMIVAKFGPKPEGSEEGAEMPKPGDDIDPGLLATAEEIHSAFKSDDVAGLAAALKSFFEQCDSMPHEEGEDEEEEEAPHPILG